MARSLLLPSSSRPCRLLKVALLCAALLPAGPALAGLPEGMGSPWVTLATGLAMMLAVAGGIYLLLLRQQLARLQAQLSAPGSSVALVGEAAPECDGCPYPRHGFLCWGADGTCLRTRMNKINGLEENTNDDSSGSR